MASREELREQAIEAAAIAICRGNDDTWTEAEHEWRNPSYRELAAAALDALGDAGFKVLGPELTDEMTRANGGLPHNTTWGKRFLAMVSAGNLTRKT